MVNRAYTDAELEAAIAAIADPERLRDEASAARRGGFAAMVAADPEQAKIINKVFSGRR